MSLRFLRSPSATPQPSLPSVTSPNRWNFLKYTVIGALTGTTILTGYTSYAYNLKEIDEKQSCFVNRRSILRLMELRLSVAYKSSRALFGCKKVN
ncbi:hypothetical protein TSUD_240400 [Trifolium subterraneum]|uniref:Uncharacterized protein n=1 Tax=Trifolium subterraneum TaxID=3900 RepID=A0A2Z6NCR3_TRISU|nr:hypothetical protein TSUD_240400 [Trifolium subterraneum]